MPTTVAAVLLAAGASRRLGEPKQLLCDETGTPAVVRMVRALQHGGCERVVVVLGANAEAVRSTLESYELAERVTCVTNDSWSNGMGTSIATGVAALDVTRSGNTEDVDHALLVAACDMPAVDAAHVRALLRHAQNGARVASCYAGADGRVVRGIPAVFPESDWGRLRTLDGDAGARGWFAGDETVTVALSGGQLDLDTPDDVAQWRRRWSTTS